MGSPGRQHLTVVTAGGGELSMSCEERGLWKLTPGPQLVPAPLPFTDVALYPFSVLNPAVSTASAESWGPPSEPGGGLGDEDKYAQLTF